MPSRPVILAAAMLLVGLAAKRTVHGAETPVSAWRLVWVEDFDHVEMEFAAEVLPGFYRLRW